MEKNPQNYLRAETTLYKHGKSKCFPPDLQLSSQGMINETLLNKIFFKLLYKQLKIAIQNEIKNVNKFEQ